MLTFVANYLWSEQKHELLGLGNRDCLRTTHLVGGFNSEVLLYHCYCFPVTSTLISEVLFFYTDHVDFIV